MTFHKTPEILAVDDVPDNLLLLEAILNESAAYQLTCVASGEEALRVVKANPPDLILLDIMMPGMNGYEVTRRIRQSEKQSHIPILFLTANPQISEEMSTQAGANGLIHKPFNIDELIARIRSLLRV